MNQKLEIVQLLAPLGVQIPWRPGEFLCDLHVLPVSAWDVFLQTLLHLIFYFQPTAFWIYIYIYCKQYFPPRNDTLMQNMFQEPSVFHGLTGIKHDYPSLTYNCIAFIDTSRHVPSSLGASGTVQGTFYPFGKHGNKNTLQIGYCLIV